MILFFIKNIPGARSTFFFFLCIFFFFILIPKNIRERFVTFEIDKSGTKTRKRKVGIGARNYEPTEYKSEGRGQKVGGGRRKIEMGRGRGRGRDRGRGRREKKVNTKGLFHWNQPCMITTESAVPTWYSLSVRPITFIISFYPLLFSIFPLPNPLTVFLIDLHHNESR